MNHATNEWILFLDADETIASSDYGRIRDLTKKTEFLGFSLIQRNYTNNIGEFGWVSGKDDSYDESKKAYVFIDEVHKKSGWESWIRKKYDLMDGEKFVISGSCSYLLKKTPEKIRRYIELEKKNLKDDFFQYCKIGIQLHSIQENDEAVEFLKKSIEKNQEFPF